METPSDALKAMVGGASAASDLDAVTAADVKAAAAAAVESGVTVAAVGNVGEVRLFYFFGECFDISLRCSHCLGKKHSGCLGPVFPLLFRLLWGVSRIM